MASIRRSRQPTNISFIKHGATNGKFNTPPVNRNHAVEIFFRYFVAIIHLGNFSSVRAKSAVFASWVFLLVPCRRLKKQCAHRTTIPFWVGKQQNPHHSTFFSSPSVTALPSLNSR